MVERVQRACPVALQAQVTLRLRKHTKKGFLKGFIGRAWDGESERQEGNLFIRFCQVSLDIKIPFPESQENKYILLIGDQFSSKYTGQCQHVGTKFLPLAMKLRMALK